MIFLRTPEMWHSWIRFLERFPTQDTACHWAIINKWCQIENKILYPLENANEIKSLNMLGVPFDPIFDPLRNEPKIQGYSKEDEPGQVQSLLTAK